MFTQHFCTLLPKPTRTQTFIKTHLHILRTGRNWNKIKKNEAFKVRHKRHPNHVHYNKNVNSLRITFHFLVIRFHFPIFFCCCCFEMPCYAHSTQSSDLHINTQYVHWYIARRTIHVRLLNPLLSFYLHFLLESVHEKKKISHIDKCISGIQTFLHAQWLVCTMTSPKTFFVLFQQLHWAPEHKHFIFLLHNFSGYLVYFSMKFK